MGLFLPLQQKELRQALISAFPDAGQFELLLKDHFPETRTRVLPTDGGYEVLVDKAIVDLEAHGQAGDLVVRAFARNPANVSLTTFFQRHLRAVVPSLDALAHSRIEPEAPAVPVLPQPRRQWQPLTAALAAAAGLLLAINIAALSYGAGRRATVGQGKAADRAARPQAPREVVLPPRVVSGRDSGFGAEDVDQTRRLSASDKGVLLARVGPLPAGAASLEVAVSTCIKVVLDGRAVLKRGDSRTAVDCTWDDARRALRLTATDVQAGDRIDVWVVVPLNPLTQDLLASEADSRAFLSVLVETKP